MTIHRGFDLRSDHNGPNSSRLHVRWVPDRALEVEGHDFGPMTEMMSYSGEYESRWEIRLESIPELLRRLGAAEDADVLTVLRNWTGRRSYEFQRLAADLSTNFWCWP